MIAFLWLTLSGNSQINNIMRTNVITPPIRIKSLVQNPQITDPYNLAIRSFSFSVFWILSSWLLSIFVIIFESFSNWVLKLLAYYFMPEAMSIIAFSIYFSSTFSSFLSDFFTFANSYFDKNIFSSRFFNRWLICIYEGVFTFWIGFSVFLSICSKYCWIVKFYNSSCIWYYSNSSKIEVLVIIEFFISLMPVMLLLTVLWSLFTALLWATVSTTPFVAFR